VAFALVWRTGLWVCQGVFVSPWRCRHTGDAIPLTAALLQAVATSWNFPWYMTDSFQESYVKVVVNGKYVPCVTWIQPAALLWCRETTKLCKHGDHKQCFQSWSTVP